jgi:hypothetical protein
MKNYMKVWLQRGTTMTPKETKKINTKRGKGIKCPNCDKK